MTDHENNDLFQLLLKANTKQTEDIKAEIKASEKNVTEKITTIQKKVVTLEKKCLFFERKIRRNNIVLFGLERENNENLVQKVTAKLNELLHVNITLEDINNIYRIGQSSKSPVIVEFISYLRKADLFKDPEKLRALRNTPISISNDLCYEDRKEQKILRQHLKLAREQNKEAKIKGNKLEIGGKLYTTADLGSTGIDSDESAASSDESDLDGDRETDGKSGGQQDNRMTRVEKNKGKRLLHKSPTPPNYKDTRGNRKKRK